MLRSDVLPAPFGPMIEVMPPRRTEIDTPSTARTPPNRFDTPAAASRTSSASADPMLAPVAMPLALLPKNHDGALQRRYGSHDAGAIARMQHVASRPANVSGIGVASRRLPLRPPRETIHTDRERELQ